MSKKLLIITVGLPRSGKSTWAQGTGHPIVNRDAIRLSLHGQPYAAAAEGMVTTIEELMVKALFLAGHSTVIVDATHTTVERRHRWIRTAGLNEWHFSEKMFETPSHVCIARAKAGNREELIPVIERMALIQDFMEEAPCSLI